MIRAVVVSLLLAIPTAAEDKPLTPEQVGKVVTVEMRVKSFGIALREGPPITLESKTESKGEPVLSVTLGPKVVQSLKEKNVVKAGDALVGKTIQAKGIVRESLGPATGKRSLRVNVDDPADFKVVEKK
jgi:hypothetical protein